MSDTTGTAHTTRPARHATAVPAGVPDPLARIAEQVWWLILLRGVVAIVFGVIAIASPWSTAAALAIVIGAFVAVEGLIDVVEAFRHRKFGGMVLHAVVGAVGVIAGVIMLAWPGITLVVVVYTVAFWAIISGVVQVALGATTRGLSVGARIWVILGGVLSFAFGVLMLTQPATGLGALVWIIGVYAIIFGTALVAFAFAARSAAKQLSAGSSTV
ncbi:HdeD family acid-resistance protein [Sanguibacter hominis ATCC BAA-789]|uniref:HdeD family acid-resistance protein n=1 Tax=Sanguibacter hominis ATCC BAA-789 TaxID=1312740 RepID=A0A9X5ISC9_9MICO|nr:HdeD family acid-resistance protein [Sanguibacter hominis]NKX92901.1 HdeD family acid-resistance protein [Sanguibacter hominis ATCC BAA-789]